MTILVSTEWDPCRLGFIDWDCANKMCHVRVCWKFVSQFVTNFYPVSRLVSGVQDTISIPSTEEERVETLETFTLCNF